MENDTKMVKSVKKKSLWSLWNFFSLFDTHINNNYSSSLRSYISTLNIRNLRLYIDVVLIWSDSRDHFKSIIQLAKKEYEIERNNHNFICFCILC